MFEYGRRWSSTTVVYTFSFGLALDLPSLFPGRAFCRLKSKHRRFSAAANKGKMDGWTPEWSHIPGSDH